MLSSIWKNIMRYSSFWNFANALQRNKLAPTIISTRILEMFKCLCWRLPALRFSHWPKSKILGSFMNAWSAEQKWRRKILRYAVEAWNALIVDIACSEKSDLQSWNAYEQYRCLQKEHYLTVFSFILNFGPKSKGNQHTINKSKPKEQSWKLKLHQQRTSYCKC
jgi:hypothetical protein